MRYVAVKNNSGLCLSRNSQLDRYLANGFDIVAIDEDGKEDIIATDGEWLKERPNLDKLTTVRISGME